MHTLVSLLDLIAPFFGLIGLGFACGKLKRFPDSGLIWMNFFIIYVALPPLFYKLIADKPLEQLLNGWFVLATTLSTFIVFVISFGIGMVQTRGDMPEAVMQGMAGSYANVGYMGPPLVLSVLGMSASAPVALVFVADIVLLFTLVPFLMALAGAEKRPLGQTLLDIVRKIVTHPFNIAAATGIVASYFRFELPGFADRMVTWLSSSAAPCALFILGVTVALRPIPKMTSELPALVFMKLVAHPLVVWLMLSLIGNFDATWSYAAVLMAALPPAMTSFVVATQYKIGLERASACILVGTMASMVTLTAWLWFMQSGHMQYDLFPHGLWR